MLYPSMDFFISIVNKNVLYKQFVIQVIWNSVSLSIYGNTQADFGRMAMHGSRKFCQRGSKFDNVFLFLFFFSFS